MNRHNMKHSLKNGDGVIFMQSAIWCYANSNNEDQINKTCLMGISVAIHKTMWNIY